MPPENDPNSQNGAPQIAEEQLGNMVNGAVKAHLQRFIEKQLPALFEAQLKPIMEKLTAPAAQTPPSEDEGKGKKGKQNQDPEYLAMAKKLEDMEKAIQERDQKVAAAEKAARDQRAFTELRSGLSDKLRPEVVDFVAKYLMQVEQRVDFDESGNVLFKSTRAPFAGADPEEIRLPLRSGLEDFLKSDAAKPFLPAPTTSSAPPLPKRGAAPNQGGTDFSKPATSDADKVRRAQERARIAQERGVKQ